MASNSSTKFGGGNQSKKRGRRNWSLEEETLLVNCLLEICSEGWRSQNSTFRPGYLMILEKKIRKEYPDTDLRAVPNIESKIRKMKKDYGLLYTIVSKSGIGFAGNKIEVINHDVWDDICKGDDEKRGMLGKEWPFYEQWGIIFGKDRATGEFATDIEDMIQETNATTSARDADEVSQTVGQDQQDTSETQSSRRRKRKKMSDSDGMMEELRGIKEVLYEYTNNSGKHLAEIAHGVKYEQDVADARRRVYGELEKIEGLGCNDRFDVGYKI